MVGIAAESSRQGQPLSSGPLQTGWPAVAPPVRSAEPFTVEHWVLFTQPRQAGLSLLTNQMQLWSRTDNGVWPGARAPPASVLASGFPFQPYDSVQASSQLMLFRGTNDRLNLVCASASVVECPRRTFDPDCTPAGVRIPWNDTCRQTVLWPRTFGDSQPATSNKTHCPAPIVPFSGPLDGFNELRQGHRGASYGWVHAAATCAGRALKPVARDGLPSMAYSLSWQQSVTTIWPPGTVAVLPVGPNATASGDPADYPWRVNRGHVIVQAVNVPATRVRYDEHEAVSRDVARSYKPMQCGDYVGLAPIAPDAQLVFLEDVSCIKARSCRPDVGSETNSSAPSYRKSVDSYISSDIRQLFPTGVVGCALTYSLDRDVYNADLLPVDMPLAQNGAGFSIGSIVRGYLPSDYYVPAVRGRWANESSAATSQATHGGLQHSDTAARQHDAAAHLKHQEQQQYPTMSNALLHGPYAVYRGPALLRAVPPHPNVSLPTVHGGAWKCSRTYPHGYFQERPRCIAVCNDPDRIAVDVDLEKDASLAAAGTAAGADAVARDGWALVASQARQWYSYWLGYPGLVQDERLYGNDRLAQVPALGSVRPIVQGISGPMYGGAGFPHGAVRSPQLRCMPDDDDVWDRSWSRSSRWAQRLPVSRGHIDFVLSFDASAWPAAVPLSSQGHPPGLRWPRPSLQYLEWLAGDIEMDVDDIIGGSVLPQSPVACYASVLRVSSGQSELKPNCSSQDMRNGWCHTLPQNISVRLFCGATTHRGGRATSWYASIAARQRALTPGSVLYRIARRIRGGTNAGLAGVWLIAADPASVDVSISLPQIPAVETALAACRQDGNRDHCLHPTDFPAAFYPALVATTSAVLGAALLFVTMSVIHAAPLAAAWALVCMQLVFWTLPLALRLAKLQWPAFYLSLGLTAGAASRGLVLLGCLYPISFSTYQSEHKELAVDSDMRREYSVSSDGSIGGDAQSDNRRMRRLPRRTTAAALLGSHSSYRQSSRHKSELAGAGTAPAGTLRESTHLVSGMVPYAVRRGSAHDMGQEFPAAMVSYAFQPRGLDLTDNNDRATEYCSPGLTGETHRVSSEIRSPVVPAPTRCLANILTVSSSDYSDSMPGVLSSPTSPIQLGPRPGTCGQMHAVEASSGDGSHGRLFVLDDSDEFDRPAATSPSSARVCSSPSTPESGAHSGPPTRQAGGAVVRQPRLGRALVPVDQVDAEDRGDLDEYAHPVCDTSTEPEGRGEATQSSAAGSSRSAVSAPTQQAAMTPQDSVSGLLGQRSSTSTSHSGRHQRQLELTTSLRRGTSLTPSNGVATRLQSSLHRVRPSSSGSTEEEERDYSSSSDLQVNQRQTPIGRGRSSRVPARHYRDSLTRANGSKFGDRAGSGGCMLQPGSGSSLSGDLPRPSCGTLGSALALDPEVDSDTEDLRSSSNAAGYSSSNDAAASVAGVDPARSAFQQLAETPMFSKRLFDGAYPRVIHGMGAALAVLQWDALEGTMAAFDAAKAGEWFCCRGRLHHEFAGEGEAGIMDRLLADQSSGGGSVVDSAQYVPGAVPTAPRPGASRWTRHRVHANRRDTAVSAPRGWASLVFRLFDVAVVCSALVWAVLCSLGQCPVGACMRDPGSDLAAMPPVLLLWDRVVVAGVAVGASVVAIAATLSLKL